MNTALRTGSRYMYTRNLFPDRIPFRTKCPLLQIANTCPLCKRRIDMMTRTVSGETVAVVAPKVSVESDELEDTPCLVCGSTDSDCDQWALLCDGCNGCYHTFCIGLDFEVPDGDWYCQNCTNNDQPAPTITNHEDTERKEPEQETLATHSQSASVQEEWYCAQCMRHFAHRRSWKRHMRSHLDQDEVCRCQYCPYHSNRRSNMIRHCRDVHPSLVQGH